MADAKISALTAISAVADEDVLPIVDDPSGTPITKKATVTQLQTQLLDSSSNKRAKFKRSDNGYFIQLVPPDASGGYLQNLPFYINGYETTNAPNLTKNYVVTMGHNLSPGGGRVDSSDSAIGLSFEQRYDAGDLSAGGLPLTEHHTFFVTKTATTGISAGKQIRLASYTINKTTNNIDYYQTLNRFYLFKPTYQSFANPSNGQYFLVQPGNMFLSRGLDRAVDTTTWNQFTIDLTGEEGVGSGKRCQFSTSGEFSFNKSARFVGLLNIGSYYQGSGTLTLGSSAQFISNSTEVGFLCASGSIDAGRRITSRRSFEGYDIAISAAPTPQGNRIQLFGQKLNGVLKWWLMDAAGTTAPILDGRFSSSTADPTTTEFPTSGQWGVHKNTSSGNLYLCANDGGTIKKVALT